MLDKSTPLLVIIGPSAAGKTSVIRELVAQKIIEVTPSWTTRPRRADEDDTAVEHVFCSEAEFESVKEGGIFLESAQLFGLPYYYGLPKIPKPPVEVVPLIMLRVMVLPLLYKFYDNPVVYQIEAPKDLIAERLEERGKQGTENGTRLSDYEMEVTKGREVASRVFVNDDIMAIVEAIKQAIIEDF
jgi:guanylate kinase